MALIGTQWVRVDLRNVLYQPGGMNLFSHSVIFEEGYSAYSTTKGTIFYNQNGKESIRAEPEENGNMHVMLFRPVEKVGKALFGKRVLEPRWHERMGHVNMEYIRKSVKDGAVFLAPGDVLEDSYKCDICVKAKATMKPYKSQAERDFAVGELLHTDLVHAVAKSHNRNKYFLLVKDSASNYRVAYFQNTKNAETTVANLIDAVHMFTTQTKSKVKRVKSDKGSEYRNQKWVRFCSENGILHEFTPAGCSESNGKIEREVRTIRNIARAMLIEVGLPEVFWQDAVSMAVYMLNRLLSSTNPEKTPYEMMYGRKPNLSHVRIFGCAASARLHGPNGEWTSRTREGILVGHVPDTREYKLWDKERREYFSSRPVDFFDYLIRTR